MPNFLEVSNGSFYEEVKLPGQTVIVDCWAPWCAPCKALGVTLDEIAEERPGVKIVMLNVDANPGLASSYGVRSVPTLLAFKGGAFDGDLKGNASKATVLKWIDAHVGP